MSTGNSTRWIQRFLHLYPKDNPFLVPMKYQYCENVSGRLYSKGQGDVPLGRCEPLTAGVLALDAGT